MLLSKILPYEKNVKRHSEDQVKKLAKSIEEYGYIQPIVVDEKNVIVIWHGRFEALRYLKKKDADVIVLKWFSETKLKALRIADNKLNESPFDYSNLKTEMEEILKDGGIDLEDLWFTMVELEELQLTLQKAIQEGEEDLEDVSAQVEQASQDAWIENPYDFKNIQGTQNSKQPMTFFCSKEEFEKLQAIYWTTRKREFNVEKLIEITDFYFENNA